MTDIAPSSDTAAAVWGAVADAWASEVGDADAHLSAATDALLEHLAIQPGERVLELAAGPGMIAPRLSAAAGPDGHVTISDVAPAMVDVARRVAVGLGNVDVAVLDLAAIDRPDVSFDAVACRMGLMFVDPPERAFAEIRRVLAPGGRFGALVWAGIEHNPWLTSVGMAAMIHGLVSGGPPIGPGQIFSLGDPGRLADLARSAGLADVAVTAHDVVFTNDSLDAHVTRVSALAGPLAEGFRTATPEQLAAVRATAAELAAPHTAPDGSVALPGRALLVTGRT